MALRALVPAAPDDGDSAVLGLDDLTVGEALTEFTSAHERAPDPSRLEAATGVNGDTVVGVAKAADAVVVLEAKADAIDAQVA